MLSTKDGVKEVKVSLENKEGVVRFLASKVSAKELAEQIEDMGFEAYVKSVDGKPVEKCKYF